MYAYSLRPGEQNSSCRMMEARYARGEPNEELRRINARAGILGLPVPSLHHLPSYPNILALTQDGEEQTQGGPGV